MALLVSLMPLLTTEPIFFWSLNVSHSVLILVNPHPPYLKMDQFIFHRLIYLFDTCVGIGSVQMRSVSIRKDWPCQRCRPWLLVTSLWTPASARTLVRCSKVSSSSVFAGTCHPQLARIPLLLLSPPPHTIWLQWTVRRLCCLCRETSQCKFICGMFNRFLCARYIWSGRDNCIWWWWR